VQLSNLQKIVAKDKKRVGRGNGSGKGKTSARGQKGQKARGRIRVDFEGGQLRLIKRLPFKRGVGNASAESSLAIQVGLLNSFKANTTVDKEALIKAGLMKKSTGKFKIVGGGDLSVALNIEVPVTKSVQEMVEKAGGKVS
jgi:large subunit ribosomal protein L15